MRPPTHVADAAAAKKAAQKFETVFVSEFLGSMFQGLPTDGPFGGGEGEGMFRSLMLDEYAKQFEKQGGFGLAAPVAAELIRMQEGRK